MNKDKVFLLGVGAQKAGTSWLHDYLSGHPECIFEPIKEYHVFDVACQPENFGGMQLDLLKSVKELIIQKRQHLREPTPQLDHFLRSRLTRIMMRLDPEFYADHFRRLARQNPGARLFGDITPSYSNLTADQFRDISDLFKDTPFDLRVTYILRDPISRIFSGMNHIDRNYQKKRGVPIPVSSVDRFAEDFTSRVHALRSDYAHTMRALDRAFPAQNIHITFYEELFSDTAVRTLCDFLRIGHVPADFGKRVNASPTDKKLRPEDVAKARKHLNWVYQYCFDRFGEERIRSIWAHA